MKKSLFLCVFVFSLAACSLSRMNKPYRGDINGRWTLNKISYEGSQGKFKSTLFSEADAECFQGSVWTFNSNNSIGSYTLNGGGKDCPSVSRQIRWSVYEPGDGGWMLQFKRVDTTTRKSVEDDSGYRLYIDSVTPSSMILRSQVIFEGKPLNILYKFTKI